MGELKSTRGQTLLEVLAALGTAAIVVGAITVVVISALNNAQFSKNQNLATQYAQQGMELLRQVRDTNWTTFASYPSGDYCLDKGSSTPRAKSIDCGQNVDIFVREVVLERGELLCLPPTPPPSPTNVVRATVTVSWSDSKCTGVGFCHRVRLVSCLSDFSVVPTP